MSNQLSNVLGVPIPYDLKRQLDVRSQKIGADTRSSDDIQYLANRSCWLRLVSSVRIKDLEYFRKYFPGLDVKDPDSLAKKFVLFAGTSEYVKNQQSKSGFEYNLRSGFGSDGSYGMLGNVETQLYGYKPMPGITDARIETQGKLGSIRSATINFKVWDKAQLDIVDALYFKLGYAMFLEWGHTTYFDNGDGFDAASPKLQRSDLKQIDPFSDKIGIKKEILLREIATRIDESNGNYDAMLGMCTNFNYSMNEDGGYDCTIKIIALGELASQIKINQAGTLPGILSAEIKELVNIYNQILREKARQAAIAATNTSPVNNTTPTNNTATKAKLMGDSLTGCLAPNTTKTQPIGVDGATGVTNANWGTGWSCISLLKAINEQTIDTTITNIFISMGTNDTFIELGSASVSKVVSALKLKYPIAKLYIMQGSYGWGNVKNGAKDYYGNTITNIEDRIKKYYAIWQSNGVTILDNPPIYSTAHPAVSTPGIKSAAIAIDKILASQPTAVVDQAAIDKANTSKEDEAIAKKFYTAVSDLGTDVTDLKSALEQIKDSAQYVRVKTLLQNRGPEKKSIVDWINAELGGNSYIGDNTQDVRDIIDILNNKVFKQNFASAQYETSVNIFTQTPTVLYKNNSFTVDNTALDAALKASATPPAAASTTPPAPAPDPIPQISADTVQKEEQLQYQSGLEVFLRAIQLHSFNIAYSDATTGKISKIDLFGKKEKFIVDLFSNGILSKSALDFATDKISNYKNPENTDSPIQLMNCYASYGFNHNLMAQSKKTQKITVDNKKIPQVNFKELYKSYVVPYSVNQSIAKDVDINYPVYIKFGLLLLALNHMCTIYDSSEGKKVDQNEQTPLIYIDFNPETNFCLSEPLQISTDPLKMLIPFRGTNVEYSKLFDPKLIDNGKIKAPSGSTETKELFKPQTQDFISSQLPEFRGTDLAKDGYSGKIMNILLSCDYLLSLCKNFASNDQTQSVKLRPFLQQIIDDINKYLGGINLLRLAYDDKSNCLYIVDDQIQPTKLDEMIVPTVTVKSEIPVYGKYSIAKSLEIKTDMTSKLSNMLAISANSDIKSDVSKDATPFGHYNANYTDRFIPQVLSINTSDTSKKNQEKKPIVNDAEIAAASAFNEFVKCALNTGLILDTNTSAATNYYIDRMNKRKGENPGTESSAMIPVSVNFSTDGLSGLAMGHAFLLPDNILPKSYQRKINSNSDSIIGFVVTGLNHSLQNNSWITEVKANMLFLKDDKAFKAEKIEYNIEELSSGNFIIPPPPPPTINNTNNYNSNTNTPLNLNGGWAEIAANFIKSQEGFISKAAWDENHYRGGYGTDRKLVNGKLIEADATTTWTQQEALDTLIYELPNSYAPILIKYLKQSNWDKCNDKQKAALISLAYNAGSGFPTKSYGKMIVSGIESGNFTAAAQGILNGPTTGASTGKVYPALVKRRQLESQLFLS